jgi:hypothetical protein
MGLIVLLMPITVLLMPFRVLRMRIRVLLMKITAGPRYTLLTAGMIGGALVGVYTLCDVVKLKPAVLVPLQRRPAQAVAPQRDPLQRSATCCNAAQPVATQPNLARTGGTTLQRRSVTRVVATPRRRACLYPQALKPFQFMGMNALFVFVMAASGLFDNLVGAVFVKARAPP